MKKLIIGMLAVMVIAVVGMADSVTVTLDSGATGAAAYSDALFASGYLDRIELVRDSDTAAETNQITTVVLATYSGTTALNTYMSATLATGAVTKVVSPRAIGQTTAGVNLAAAANGTNDYTAGTVLVAPYERMMIGGNSKLAVSGNATNCTVTATVYFEPLQK